MGSPLASSPPHPSNTSMTYHDHPTFPVVVVVVIILNATLWMLYKCRKASAVSRANASASRTAAQTRARAQYRLTPEGRLVYSPSISPSEMHQSGLRISTLDLDVERDAHPVEQERSKSVRLESEDIPAAAGETAASPRVTVCSRDTENASDEERPRGTCTPQPARKSPPAVEASISDGSSLTVWQVRALPSRDRSFIYSPNSSRRSQ